MDVGDGEIVWKMIMFESEPSFVNRQSKEKEGQCPSPIVGYAMAMALALSLASCILHSIA